LLKKALDEAGICFGQPIFLHPENVTTLNLLGIRAYQTQLRQSNSFPK